MTTQFRREWLSRKGDLIREEPDRRDEVVEAVLRWLRPEDWPVELNLTTDLLWWRDPDSPMVTYRSLAEVEEGSPEVAAAIREDLVRRGLTYRAEPQSDPMTARGERLRQAAEREAVR